MMVSSQSPCGSPGTFDVARQEHLGRWLPTERMSEQETQHLPRRVGPALGVGSGGTASRPGVAGTVDIPMLGDRTPSRVIQDRAGISMAVRNLSANHLRFQACCVGAMLDDLGAVPRMYRGVAIAMKNDGRHRTLAGRYRLGFASLPHGGERGRKITGGPTGETGMNANRRVQVWIRCPHDGGRRPRPPIVRRRRRASDRFHSRA